MAAYALSAAPFSIFFGGGWVELIVSTCVGLAVGLIAFYMARFRRVGRPFEFVAAAAAAFIAGSADEILGAYGGWIPLAAGLVVLLPGIALVDALEELASGQLTAGGQSAGGRRRRLSCSFTLGRRDRIPGGRNLAEDPRRRARAPAGMVYRARRLLVVAFGSTLRLSRAAERLLG